MSVTVEAKGIKKVYIDSHNNQVKVFENLTYSFETGRLYAIFGPSGCGKSTLLHLSGLLDRPTSGEVLIGGKRTWYLAEKEKADLRRDHIGFVFQNHYLDEKSNVMRNMELPLKINKKIKKSEYESLIMSLLGMFGMEEYAHRYPHELSGGEQQRVCIARALVNAPDIILADEPTGNLDEENGRIVLNCLKRLAREGKTVVIASHDEEVKKYADVVYLLKGGILIEEKKENRG